MAQGERYPVTNVPFRVLSRALLMCIGPIMQKDSLLAHALEIAMDYLEHTGQAEDYGYVQAVAMGAILKAFQDGVDHRIALANRAIVAIEKPASSQNIVSIYPRTG